MELDPHSFLSVGSGLVVFILVGNAMRRAALKSTFSSIQWISVVVSG
jgi:hypothetical protein